MREAERDEPEDRAIVLRMGLHLGDLIVEEDDLFGDGVNVAARLEAEAPPGGILISRTVHEAVAGRMNASFEDLGNLQLKNIDRPVQAFAVTWDPAAVDAARRAGGAASPWCGKHYGGGGARPARQALDRRSAVRQHVGRSRAGALRRRRRRIDHRRAVAYPRLLRHRPQLGLRLQGPADQRARHRPRARRRLRAGGQRAARRPACAHHRPAHRDDGRRAPLG